MNKEEIINIVETQKEYFNSGATRNIKNRKVLLKKLKQEIIANEEELFQALKKDLGKSASESYMCEVGLVLSELSYVIKHINKFCKKRRVKTPLSQFHSKSFELAVPYGNVLVMSPWNYPFLLSIDPIIEAVAAGNTVVLKTSEYSPYSNIAIKNLIEKVFEPGLVSVVFGGYEENSVLINTKFDYVFFTGSKHVGKIVYQKASENLTPCTLELGGKSPCIVDETANLKLAARRIVFGKYLNCGQTCVAPDYLYCQESIKDELLKYIKEEIEKQYGASPLKNNDYGKIITQKHYNRVSSLIDDNKVIYGGEKIDSQLKISPTIMDNVSFNDKIMQEEIFGPILPVLTYSNFSEVKENVTKKDTPLACYIFSSNKKTINDVLYNIDFGGGCVNDTIIHLATSEMRFGGLKDSGLGSYHGKTGFDTFSHYKSIVDKKTWIDLSMRYQPYNSFKDYLIKKFLK